MNIILLFVGSISLTRSEGSYYNITDKNKEMRFGLDINFITLLCIL